MSDSRAIILTIVGTGLTVVTILSMQIAAVNTRIDDVNRRIDDMNHRIDEMRTELRDLRSEMRTDLRDLRTELRRFDGVEVAVGKVEQRLDTMERVLLPSREPPGE